jgi:hypothetical protein
MRKLVLATAAVLALSFGVSFTHAADSDKKISGVLIDDHCVGKFTDKADPEKAAEAHPVACAIKCGKDGRFVLLHGKEQLMLDKHGQELAMAYLMKPDASTKVTITGEKKGDEFKVDSIDKKEAAH